MCDNRGIVQLRGSSPVLIIFHRDLGLNQARAHGNRAKARQRDEIQYSRLKSKDFSVSDRDVSTPPSSNSAHLYPAQGGGVSQEHRNLS